MNDDIFCEIIKGEIPSKTCYEDDIVKCIMDVSPQSPGHTLIIPKKHYTDILEIEEDVATHINKIAKIIINRMMNNFTNIDGVVTVINYGSHQVVKHYHMHLIPTYSSKCGLTQEEACEILKRG